MKDKLLSYIHEVEAYKTPIIRPVSVSLRDISDHFKDVDIQTIKRELLEFIKQGKLSFYFNHNEQVYFYTDEEKLI